MLPVNNNNCSISRLLDWFRRTGQGSGKQQTSLRMRCGIARLTIYFLNVSAVNTKLTSPSDVYQLLLLFWRRTQLP